MANVVGHYLSNLSIFNDCRLLLFEKLFGCYKLPYSVQKSIAAGLGRCCFLKAVASCGQRVQFALNAHRPHFLPCLD